MPHAPPPGDRATPASRTRSRPPPSGRALASRDGVFDRVNPALCAITGSAAEELVARTAVDLVHPGRPRARGRPDGPRARRARRRGRRARSACSPPTAASRWAQMHFTRAQRRAVLLTQVIDVSERRGLEVELRHQAEHDALTELLNRRGFQRRLGALLEHGAPGRGDADRPRPLQGGQRHARPPRRRPGDPRGGRGAARTRCAPTTSSPASAATSSRCCCRARTASARTPPPSAWSQAVEPCGVEHGGHARSVGVAMLDGRARRPPTTR